MKTALLSLAVVAVAGLPGIASASTLSVDGTGTIQYQAAPAEANRLALVQPFASPYVFADTGAALSAGSGCTPAADLTASCPAGPIVAALGDGDDAAMVNAFLTGPVTVDGGAGDDDIFAGSSSSASVTGGSGGDTIVLSTNSRGTAEGGSGDDQLAGRSSQDELFGGSGNDLLTEKPTRSSLPLHGDNGADRIVATGSSAPIEGGAGNDLLINGPDIQGGAGADRIVKGGGGRVRAGSGNDIISAVDATGLGTDIKCGDGIDVVWADPEDTVDADCEYVFAGPAPTIPGAAQAIADAQALLAHVPNVS